MQERFLKGALYLLLGSGISRVLGAVYRIFLPYVFGAGSELGMGLYGMAYPIYTLSVGISTAGIPLALSKLISDRIAGGRTDEAARFFRLARWILAGMGLAFTVALYLLAPWLSVNIFHDPRVVYSLRAVAPAALLASIVAAYRGYFQGYQEMGPHALSQVVEQTFRIGAMFLAAALLLPLGITYAAAGASFGAVVGAGTALAYLMYMFQRKGKPRARTAGHAPNRDMDAVMLSHVSPKSRSDLHELLLYALPIFFTGMVAPIMNVVDSFIVPGRLHAAGFETDTATSLFGHLSGFAQPFTVVPTVVTVALATALLPAIAEANALGRTEWVEARVRLGIRLTLLFCLPAAAGLWLLSSAIPDLFYGLPEVGPTLAVLALSVPFVTLQQTSASILQGLGQPQAPMKHLLAGLVLKVAFTWVLTALPSWNIRGAAAATAIAFLVAAVLNLRSIAKSLPGVIPWLELIGRPLLATLVMAGVVAAAMDLLPSHVGSKWATLASIVFGVIAYFVATLWTKAIGRDDWEPFLQKVRNRVRQQEDSA